ALSRTSDRTRPGELSETAPRDSSRIGSATEVEMQASWMTPTEKPCSAEELEAEGVRLERLDVRNMAASIERAKKTYDVSRDEILFMTLDNPKHEGAIAKEADEHAHLGDEVRAILEGAAIYEERARDDRWIRLSVGEGELVVIPAQRYH